METIIYEAPKYTIDKLDKYKCDHYAIRIQDIINKFNSWVNTNDNVMSWFFGNIEMDMNQLNNARSENNLYLAIIRYVSYDEETIVIEEE